MENKVVEPSLYKTGFFGVGLFTEIMEKFSELILSSAELIRNLVELIQNHEEKTPNSAE
jgi:hypothetical protein